MTSSANDVAEYIENLPEERKSAFGALRDVIIANMPKGLKEEMSYGMIGYVVPHSIYPNGYHCNPKLPLPFVNLASQKNFIALYHMGMYADMELNEWFVSEYSKRCKYKLDMGKSCVRFKKMDDIPFDLVGELMQKMTVENWINLYENSFKR